MKTQLSQPTLTAKLKMLFVFLFLAGATSTYAQCVAGYTFSVSPANDGSVAFTSTSSAGGAPFSCYWNFGDGAGSSGANPVHTYAVSGFYTVCLTIQDTTLSCSDSICYAFSVTNSSPPPPACTASFMAYDSVGYGYFVNLSSGTGISSFWDFGDGDSAASTGNTTHLYASPGTYNVCLTVTNFMGTCTNTYCDTVRIGGSSGMCNGSVTSYFTASDSSGYGVFTNTVTGTGPVYHWDFGDGSTSPVAGSTTHYYASPGTYPVCLTVYETGGTYDSCQYCGYVTIGSPAGGACDASFTIVQDSTNLFNYYVYNNSTSSSPTMTYFWDFGDGATSTLQFPTHTYADTVTYYLCLTVSDSTPMFGCTNTYCDTIGAGRSSAGISVTVVNTSTGIHDAAIETALSNYPNPFSEGTTINYSISGEATIDIKVVDLLGNTVEALENGKRPAGNYSLTWNADGVAPGMYLLQMRTNNKVSTKKIIVSR